MKRIILSFFLGVISTTAYTQNIKKDTLEYVEYTDSFGNKKKALVVKIHQILIVEGDSLYTVPNEIHLRKLLLSQVGFDIINDPDSIRSFLNGKIKSMVILKKKED